MIENFIEDKRLLPFDFVDVNGLVISANELEFLSCGANGSVWKWDDGSHKQVVKSFFDNRYHLSLPFDTCLAIQNLNFVNLPNIYSPLRRSDKPSGSYDGYLMEYFDEDKSAKLSEIPSDNLILSIEQIEEDGKKLLEHQIIMFDVKPSNSIITRDDLMLHLIDLDLYKTVSCKSYDELLFIQYKMIMAFLSMGFRKDISNDSSFSAMDKQKLISSIQQTFTFSTDYTLSPKEYVESLFSNMENSKQYFKKLL